MPGLRPALWRQAQRATTMRPAVSYSKPTRATQLHRARYQHQQHGPHKEYFQNPGQMPAPDTTPYAHGQPYIPKIESTRSAPRVGGRSLFVRITRSVLWAVLFSSLGVAAGTGLITWEYLQPPFEPGSDMEDELIGEILTAVEFHPLVDALRQSNWIEEDYYAAQLSVAHGLETKGMHLVAETLGGTQGITIRSFRHPTSEVTIMVAFLGFGVEGWPDVIHGGIITTLIQEGIDRQIANFYARHGKQEAQAISIDFKRRIRPGEVYAVIVPPAEVERDPPQKGVTHLQLTPVAVRIEMPPRITPATFALEIGSLEELHAVATVQVRLVKDVLLDRTVELEAGFTSPKIEDK